MKKVILLLSVLFSTVAFGQQYSEVYSTVKPRAAKITYSTSALSINNYGKQLRTGYTFQGIGIACFAMSSWFLSTDNTSQGYALSGAGLISMLVGQIVIWDSAKHLRVSTNGAGITVDF